MSAGIFISTFEKTIDKQSRVCVPVEFRQVLLKHRADNTHVGFIAFRSYAHQAVECYSFERMEKLSAQMDTLDPFNTTQDDFNSSVFADSHVLTFDMDEGRLKIPSILLEHACITDKICFVGKGATFQLWSPTLFNEHQQLARDALKAKWNKQKEASN